MENSKIGTEVYVSERNVLEMIILLVTSAVLAVLLDSNSIGISVFMAIFSFSIF